MSLETILESIRSSGKERVREIEENAQSQAKDVISLAYEEVDQIKKEAQQAVLAQAAKERARIIHHARLQQMQIMGKVRESLVDSAINQAYGRLAGLRKDFDYPMILQKFTEEALSLLAESMVDINQTRLQADPRDRQLVSTIIDELKLVIDADYDLESLGGMIVKSKDDRLVVINTIEARSERATPYLRRYLAAYFEEKTKSKTLEVQSSESTRKKLHG